MKGEQRRSSHNRGLTNHINQFQKEEYFETLLLLIYISNNITNHTSAC